MDLTLQQLFFRLLALLIVAPVHGLALALAAGLLGDPGPRHDGRRTLDPFAHVDILGGLGFVLFGLGWIRPVALDRQRLRFGRMGPVLVALAGLGATLLLAGAAGLLRQPVILAASGNLPLYGVVFLETLARLALGFTLLNLVPLPPLTGGHVLTALCPRLEPVLVRFKTACAIVVAAWVASGLAGALMDPVLEPLARLLLGA